VDKPILPSPLAPTPSWLLTWPYKVTPLIASDILTMRAKAPGTPASSLAGRSAMISSIDSYHIRLAVSGTSCDKYPGRSPFSLNQEKLCKVRMPFNSSLRLAELPLVC
jgi:hypothetical protein